MEVLNKMRSHTIQSNERGYLNYNAIKKQVESTFASSGFVLGARVNHTATSMGSTGGFDEFIRDPGMRLLTDDNINTYTYGIFQDDKQDYQNHNYDGNIRNISNGSA